jgi:hypothetical protein
MRSTPGNPLPAEPLYLTKHIERMDIGAGDMNVGNVTEEADESCFWSELIVEGGPLEEVLVEPLLDEANDLTAIFAAATKTSRLLNEQSKIENRT